MLVLAMNGFVVGVPVLLVGIVLGLWLFFSAEAGDRAVKQTAGDLLEVLKEKAELTEQLRKCRAACAVLQARAKEHDPQ